MSSQSLSQEFEDKVFEIIESTSFKELLNSNKIREKYIIAIYYEIIEVYDLAIQVYRSMNDYDSIRRLLRLGKQKIGKKFDRYQWEVDVFSS